MLQQFNRVATFIFDIDGVLTDGTVLVLENGVEARRMSIRDGFGLQMAVQNGYRVVIVSGGSSPQVKNRLERLGITDVHMTIEDKRSFIEKYIEQNELSREEILYMGDDLPDLPAMLLAGVPCCPADAVPEIREASVYISPRKGGDACVREVIEKVLRLHGRWKSKENLRSL